MPAEPRPQRSKSEGRPRNHDAEDPAYRLPTPALAAPPPLDVMEAVRQLKESATAQDARIKGMEVAALAQDARIKGLEVAATASGLTTAANDAPDGMEGFDGEAGSVPLLPQPADLLLQARPGAADPGHDPDLRRFLFADSAYSWLFLDEVDLGEFGSHKLLRRDRCCGLVIILQLVTYVVLGMLIYNNIEAGIQDLESPTLEIKADYCYNASLYEGFSFREAMSMEQVYDNLAAANITAEKLPELLSCSNHFQSIGNAGKYDRLNTMGTIMASYMLACFLWPDFVGAVALFTCPGRRSKAVAVIIWFEAAAAMSVGGMAVLARYSVGPLETFLLIVGIVFVHDLDEKFATAGNTVLMLYHVYGRQSVDLWGGLVSCLFFGACFCAFVLSRIHP